MLHAFSFLILAIILTDKPAKLTTVIELNGISMAATTGDNNPCTANAKPITLYRKEIP
jgi:hypothetical protein